jgi:hypothetical protein
MCLCGRSVEKVCITCKWGAGQEDPDNTGGPGGFQASSARYIEPQCLDVTSDGAIRHSECHGDRNQRWYVLKEDFDEEQGGFMLRSQDPAYDGKCLYAFEDGTMEMYNCEEARGWKGSLWYVPQLQEAIESGSVGSDSS